MSATFHVRKRRGTFNPLNPAASGPRSVVSAMLVPGPELRIAVEANKAAMAVIRKLHRRSQKKTHKKAIQRSVREQRMILKSTAGMALYVCKSLSKFLLLVRSAFTSLPVECTFVDTHTHTCTHTLADTHHPTDKIPQEQHCAPVHATRHRLCVRTSTSCTRSSKATVCVYKSQSSSSSIKCGCTRRQRRRRKPRNRGPLGSPSLHTTTPRGHACVCHG
jgi:hypothetical protein